MVKRVCEWCEKEITTEQDTVIKTDRSHKRHEYHMDCDEEMWEWYGEDLL